MHDVTPYADVQYQPKGNRSITAEEFFGPDNLARLLRICGPTMAELGYRGAEADR